MFILQQPHKHDLRYMSTFLFAHAPPTPLVITLPRTTTAVPTACRSCVPSPFPLQECGVALEDFDAFKEGDVVQCYSLDEIKRTL